MAYFWTCWSINLRNIRTGISCPGKRLLISPPQRDQVHCMPGNLISDKNRLAINYISRIYLVTPIGHERKHRNNNKQTLNNIILIPLQIRYERRTTRTTNSDPTPRPLSYQVLVLSFRVYTGERVLLPLDDRQ